LFTVEYLFFYCRIFGAHGNDLMGGEQFPDSELNLKEDYESENEEPLSTTPISLQIPLLHWIVRYWRWICMGILKKSCNCSFCIEGERSFLFGYHYCIFWYQILSLCPKKMLIQIPSFVGGTLICTYSE
jgi:hypothetical protein